MRDSIKYLLSRDNKLKLIGEAHSGEQMLTRIKALDVDVMILDIYLDGMESLKQMNGFDVCPFVKKECPHIQIVAHSAFQDSDSSKFLAHFLPMA